MANESERKELLLATMLILAEKTDEDHPFITEEIISELKSGYHLTAERKSVQNGLNVMISMGLVAKRKRTEYYFDARPLDLEELVMLVDAVQSSKFLTDDLTDRLIAGIRMLAGEQQQDMLQRRIEVPGRIKMQNESVFKNLDIIQQAMREKRQVSFKYLEYTDECKQSLRWNGKSTTLTPIQLVYASEYYYLITFNAYYAEREGGRWSNPYRVDRMVDLKVSDEPFATHPLLANFKLEDQVSPAFGIYSADKVPITLEFNLTAGKRGKDGRPLRSPMNPIVDKFGSDVQVFVKDDVVKVYTKAPLSPMFFGWLMEVGPSTGLRLVHPKDAVDMYRERLRESLALYE